MKILTLNTHSFMEENFEEKFNILVDAIANEHFDIIALQEVNQSVSASVLDNESLRLSGFIRTFGNAHVPVKKDNYALKLVKKLRELAVDYNWSWVANHIGYDKFDEGVAILSNKKIETSIDMLISKSEDYSNYRTRKILGVKVCDKWFFSVHMGWWNENCDPFSAQWDKVCDITKTLMEHEIYLMGDFNSPANVRGEGYDLIQKSDIFFDTFNLAESKDDGITVDKVIDGWRDKDISGMRIDYIFKNNNNKVKSSKIFFNGKNYDVVSDHFALCIEL